MFARVNYWRNNRLYSVFQSDRIPEEDHPAQTYFYAPITSSHKKKVFLKRPVVITTPSTPSPSTIQPPFFLENNRKPNTNYLDFVHQDHTTRSSSTESSASSTSTLRHVDTFSATPVVIPPKSFYRRRQVSFKHKCTYIYINIYIPCLRVCIQTSLVHTYFSSLGFLLLLFYMCLSSNTVSFCLLKPPRSLIIVLLLRLSRGLSQTISTVLVFFFPHDDYVGF